MAEARAQPEMGLVDAGALVKDLAAVTRGCRMAQEDGFEVDGLRPRVVVEPTSVEEAAEVMRVAYSHGAAVIPWGAGTRMGLGMPPRAADLVLSTRSLNGIVDYRPEDLTVTVRAGTPLGDLQAALGREGQFLPLDPAWAQTATIGGIIATNASGPLRLAYGPARDLVIGTRVVNADGLVSKAGGRVVKNVAGYDLNKLYIGSLGTLGVIVELSFKVWPIPPTTGTVLASFADLGAVRQVVGQVVRSPLNPQSAELMDAAVARLAAEVSLPNGHYLLAFRAAGIDRAVARQVRELTDICLRQGGEILVLAPEKESAFWSAVREFPGAQVPALAKISVPVSEVVTIMGTLAGAGEGTARGLAHAGSGIVYAQLMGDDDVILGLVNSLRGQALALGGSLVVERCPTCLKGRLDVWGPVGPQLKVMRAIKAQMDPRHILNPGRFVGGI